MIHRPEASAVGGVLLRDWVVYKRNWRSNTALSVIDPIVSLLAFGFGFGALVATVGGIDYIEFVGTGIVAQTVLFTTIFPGMFDTFFKRDYQHVYDALLAAPVDAVDVVTGESFFLAVKAGMYGMAPLLVAIGFGLDPSWGMLVVPFIGFLTGLGFACLGIFISALASTFAAFDYVISMLVAPLFLFAGTFFPLEGLPSWVAVAAHLNPLFHTVELVRHAVYGFEPLHDLGHVAALLAFAALAWSIACWRMRVRLVQ
ncbi:MAG: ABC transporter permease [Actinomycetota bacterium]|nr:ABC transporter permease [Actinomycetota bacterium]